MSMNLLDLSKKIEPLTVQLFEAISIAANKLGIPFFIVGATARDMILELGYGISVTRATKDVDIGVRLKTWDEFDGLRRELIRQGDFTETKSTQRLRFQNASPVDIVPFGPISSNKCEIAFPPDQANVMSVVGFEEALRAALVVRFRTAPPLDVLCASPAGLVILKLVAWGDGPVRRRKDAIYISLIVLNYLDLGNYERLVEEHKDLVTSSDFDYERAGARLLGRDVGQLFSEHTRKRVMEIIAYDAGGARYLRLARDMIQPLFATEEPYEDLLEKNMRLLRELEEGIREAS